MMNLSGVHLGDEVSLRGIRDIVFPEHNDHVPQVAIDIGGSLVKIAYFTRHASVIPTTNAVLSSSNKNTSKSSQPPPSTIAVTSTLVDGRGSPAGGSGGRLNFVKFETANMTQCIAFLKQLLDEIDHDVGEDGQTHERTLLATGGGAYKFYEILELELGAKIFKYDEMECLVKGLDFLVKYVPREVFTYVESQPIQFESTPPEDAYPYMLVNIGSGVSILKVTGPGQAERISGTSLGGGTYWGLLSVIGTQNGIHLDFENMLELSKEGDNTNVDMLVGDIYGMDYSKIGLKSTTIASTFGKMFKKTPEERQSTALRDISRSLLFMVSNNIGQIAYLNAQAHNLSRIYFGGYFICGHPVTMHTLSYAIQFWSRGETKALFLRHEGFLGAVGAFLQHQ